MTDLLRGLVGTLVAFYVFGLAAAQGSPGIGPQLQDQFLVGKLPNVTWSLGNQYAGNLPVQRGTNLSLFFWGAESTQGSLTAPAGENDAPWTIWLQGCVPRSVLAGFVSASSLPRLTCFPFTADLDHLACLAFSKRCAQPGFDTLSDSRLISLYQNGPIRLNANFTASENPYSWDKQADTIWIDQPV